MFEFDFTLLFFGDKHADGVVIEQFAFFVSLVDSMLPILTVSRFVGVLPMHLRYLWILLKVLPSNKVFSHSAKSVQMNFFSKFLDL